MINLEDLYNYADNENIKIKNFTDKENSLNGTCLYNKKSCNIYLNTEIENEIEKKCVLAEEIGHYIKGISITNLNDTDNTNLSLRSRNEFRAKKWAIQKLIPLNKFKRFISRNLSKYEIADELNVTVDFVEKAYELYEPILIEGM